MTVMRLFLCAAAFCLTTPEVLPADVVKRTPVIDVTDLYNPPQDPGDNFDVIAAYALPEIDLKAVVFDCTQGFREPVTRHPHPEVSFEDRNGPREPGIVAVTQLNYIFGRDVPWGAGPFAMMNSPHDKMLDVPAFQQRGVELILKTLRESREPVEIVSFGSARPVAVAFNREPNLFSRKVRRIHLSAGTSEGAFLEWNVALDPQAIVRLLRSKLPIAIYPCSAKDGALAYGPNNTFWKLPDLKFVSQMRPELSRYLYFSFERSPRPDFLRALETDWPTETIERITAQPHNVWETGIWLTVSGRKLVRRPGGRHQIVAPGEVAPGDLILPNDLRPCRVHVNDDGRYTFELTRENSNFWIYDRGDAQENERALREALPSWYLSIKP